jgi:hypothetical protein
MRAYLPLLFEILIAGAVIGWGVRELILLHRDEKKSEGEDTDAGKDETSDGTS